MIFFRLLKKKRNLALFVALCFAGAVVAYIHSVYEDNELLEAEAMYVCDSSNLKQLRFLTITTGTDSLTFKKYMDFVNEKEKHIRFRSYSIDKNQVVKVIRYEFEDQLAKVVILRNKATLNKPYREDHWIWAGYLQKEPCPENP
jgi:hypothetical protein